VTRWIYYDGACGLCHRSVLFFLKRDPDGQRFRFAPLGGRRFQREISSSQQEQLSDSVVVQADHEQLLQKSTAIFFLLRQLSGGWRWIGKIGSWLPTPFTDLGYDMIAAVRLQLFARPDGACPIVPPQLRERFDD
jgi:predicted DCC family thiol-disulfide oxidoreductase YuxK